MTPFSKTYVSQKHIFLKNNGAPSCRPRLASCVFNALLLSNAWLHLAGVWVELFDMAPEKP